MRVGLIVSAAGHGAILLWSVLAWPDAESLAAKPIEMFPVELVTIGEVTDISLGAPTAAVQPEPKPDTETVETEIPAESAGETETPADKPAERENPSTAESAAPLPSEEAAAPAEEAAEPEAEAEPEPAPAPQQEAEAQRRAIEQADAADGPVRARRSGGRVGRVLVGGFGRGRGGDGHACSSQNRSHCRIGSGVDGVPRTAAGGSDRVGARGASTGRGRDERPRRHEGSPGRGFESVVTARPATSEASRQPRERTPTKPAVRGRVIPVMVIIIS